MDQSAADTWHSIRPWIHRFALSVDQVSSVSATFTLKSALSAKPLDPILESLVEDERGDTSCAPTDSSTRPRAVSDALTQGLSVKVNSSPWQRVLLKVNEECDEAIIIVFGLMPGRQYDVELGITHQEESLRSHIITNDASPDQTDLISTWNNHVQNNVSGSTALPFVVSTRTDMTTVNVSNSLTTPLDSTPPPSASPTPSASTSGEVASPVPTPSITLDDKVHQLNQTLSLLQAERDSLALSLKTTRRDAQRADAAIRADIETLKRASDKFASVEHRARQKALALQEAVKQTLAAAADIGTAVTDVETSLPTLREQQVEAEKEFRIAKLQAAQARGERETLERQEKKRVDGLQSELVGLGSKLEKLNGKREKLETSVIPDLEEELRRIEEEIANSAGPSPTNTDRSDDAYYHGPASFGVSTQSGSITALPNLGGFPDDTRSTGQDSSPSPIEIPRRRKHLSHPPVTTKRQPQMQKPVQILRPPNHQHQARPTPSGHKPTATSGTTTSTLSSLAAPFEPSPKRQAQLQSTLGTSLDSDNITSALKAELTPTSHVYAPRMGFTTSSTSTTSHKSVGPNSNNSTSGYSAWSRGNQKPRRSDME